MRRRWNWSSISGTNEQNKVGPPLAVPMVGGYPNERSDTRKNLFSCDVVFRLKGGAYVTNESGTESAECCAGPRGLRGRVRMGRRLQRLEEERVRGDSRSGGDGIVRRRRR